MNPVQFVRVNPLSRIQRRVEPVVYPYVDEHDFNCANLNTVYAAVDHMIAQVVDTKDQTIVEAVIKAAEEAGVVDLYILDKKFVLDALREKAERDGLLR